MESRLNIVASKLYKFARPDVFSDEVRSRLPEAYKNFYKEWKMTTPSPVHYIPKPGKWERNPETGVVKPIQNVPISLRFPRESNKHLWGGEAVVQGFQKRGKYLRRTPHFWTPVLKNSIVYSEVLDKRMSVVVTDRTIDLIIKNNGFDHYLLNTPACDLQSELALKLKRKILFALYDKDLYKDDPKKQEEVYKKYKHYLDSYTKEDIEWYGLTLKEAVDKLVEIEEVVNKPKPLKHHYRAQLLAQLYEEELNHTEEGDKKPSSEERSTWLSKLNPFNRS